MLEINQRSNPSFIAFSEALKIIIILNLLCICTIYAIAAEAQATKPVSNSSVIAEDKRLDSPLSLTERNIQLDELLPRLSTKGLRLEADRSCAQQKVQIRLRHRPLRVLMQALAELLPGEWIALEKDRGYLLRMKQKTTQKRSDWWQLFMGEREKALAAIRVEVLKHMRAGREPSNNEFGTGRDPSVTDKQEAEMEITHSFFQNLPADMQERIANQMNENPSLDSGGTSTGDDEGATVVFIKELPSEMAESLRAKIASRLHTTQDKINWDTVSLEFINGGGGLLVNPVVPGFRSMGSLYGEGLHESKVWLLGWLLRPEGIPLHRTLEFDKDTPIEWKQLAAYSQSIVWKNDPPATKALYSRPPYRSDMLEWVGEKSDIEFVADFYSKPGFVMRPEEKAKPLPAPLKEFLDRQAEIQDFSWKKRDDNLYLFRNNRWYRDDYMEVPNPLLRSFLALSMTFDDGKIKSGADFHPTHLQRMYAMLNKHAEFVSALSPWQISHGLRYYAPLANEPISLDYKPGVVFRNKAAQLDHHDFLEFPFYSDSKSIIGRYHTIQFYAGLEENQRKALLTNQLGFDGLSEIQKHQVAYLIPKVMSALKQTKYPVVIGLMPKYYGEEKTSIPSIHLALVSPPE